LHAASNGSLPASSAAAVNTAPLQSSNLASQSSSSSSSGHGPANGHEQHEDAAPSKKKRASTSDGKKPQIQDDNDDSDDVFSRLDDIERRYEIPPLKLIDTGNAEADAEANRLAIEEDKRRRNTAASARFRIKKKQREAALENAAKELQQRLADLEAENTRLRTENGWLKNLITVRPDQAPPTGIDHSAVSTTFASTAAGPSGTNNINGHGPATSLPPTSNASPQVGASSDSSTSLRSGETPDRQTGLHPRGVGTQNTAKSAKANSNNDSASSGKRDREE
jgi:hypothetical protein